MRLLYKHLIRSIKKKPIQPLIIILTLTLSIATSAFAFTLEDTIKENIEATQKEKYGNGNLMISLGNSSDSRFLFADDVIDVLGESADAVGVYELPLILDDADAVSAVAVDYGRVSSIFEIEFIEYGRVTKSAVSETAFISKSLAQEKGLSIGDTILVEAMGYARDYRIEGIAEDAFFTSHDVMVDISSLVSAFAENSLLFAAIGEDFKPCSKIYVNLDRCEGLAVDEAISRLKSDPRFDGKSIEGLADIERDAANTKPLEVTVNFSVAIASLLSAVVAFFCFYILANERAEENLILICSGARPRMLGTMQYAEAVLYWLISVPLGYLLSMPLTQIIGDFVDLKYVQVAVYPKTFIKSALIILAVCLLTTTFFVVLNGRVKRTGSRRTSINAGWILIALPVLASLMIVLYLSPAAFRWIIFVAVLACIIALMFLSTPLILEKISHVIDKAFKGVSKPMVVAFRYALKNLRSIKLLHNISRLSALIVLVVFTIGFVFVGVEGMLRSWPSFYDADCVVANATDRCYEKVQTCENAEIASRSYLAASEIGTVISADNMDIYGDFLHIDRSPMGNEAIITEGVSHRLDLKLGDSFELELYGTKYSLVVSDIKTAALNYIAVNSEALGIPYNMILVDGKEGVSASELMAELSEKTAADLAPIAPSATLMEYRMSTVQMYVNAGMVLLAVFSAFSVIGMINVFYESLRSRREEFVLYRVAGASRGALLLMKAVELTSALLIGAIIGALAFIVVAFALDRGMSGFGCELILGLKQLLAL